MRTENFKLNPPWELCEVLSGVNIHLFIKVPWGQKTACGKIYFEPVHQENVRGRAMCKSCLKTLGMTTETIRKRA